MRLFRQYVFSFGQREGRLAVCVRVLFCDVYATSVSFLSSHLDTWNSVLSGMNWGGVARGVAGGRGRCASPLAPGSFFNTLKESPMTEVTRSRRCNWNYLIGRSVRVAQKG